MGASKKEEVNKEAAVGFKLPAVLYPAENSLSTKTKLPKVTENVTAENTKEEKIKENKGIIENLIEGSKSVPKIVEAAGFITLGNIFYLAGGDKGFDLYMRSSRAVFNPIWGGSIFSNDKTLANISDEEIQKVLNPLHHLSQVVEPVLSPLHQGAALVTDRLTYFGYNVYLTAQGSATINYKEYAYRKTKEEYWELRAGENTLYALETLGIAYLMVTRGGILKILGGKAGGTSALLTEGVEMAKLLRMPVIMSGLSSIGELLQQKEDPEKPLISLETLSVLIPMLIKGTFDSTVFMGALATVSRPIMGIASWRFTSVAKRDLEIWQKTIASNNNGATLEALPNSVLELPKKIARVGKVIEFGNEAVDFTEGLPDFYQQAGNVKSRLLELAYNPFEKERWRFLGGSLMQFTSSALDLVDNKKSGQHKRITEIGKNTIKPITESLKDTAIETDEGYLGFTRDNRTIAEKLNNPWLVKSLEKLGGAVLSENARVLYLQDKEAVQAFYRSRAKEIEDRRNDEIFSLRGIKSLFFGQATKQITAQSKDIESYYDRELKVTVAILPGENQTESQRICNLAIETHEAVHKRVATFGLEQVLSEEPVLNQIIQFEMGIDINQYLATPHKRIQLEEMLAYLTEYQMLNNYGLKNINPQEVDLSFFQSEDPFSSHNHYQNICDFVISNYSGKVLSNNYQQILLANRGEDKDEPDDGGGQLFQVLSSLALSLATEHGLSAPLLTRAIALPDPTKRIADARYVQLLSNLFSLRFLVAGGDKLDSKIQLTQSDSEIRAALDRKSVTEVAELLRGRLLLAFGQIISGTLFEGLVDMTVDATYTVFDQTLGKIPYDQLSDDQKRNYHRVRKGKREFFATTTTINHNNTPTKPLFADTNPIRLQLIFEQKFTEFLRDPNNTLTVPGNSATSFALTLDITSESEFVQQLRRAAEYAWNATLIELSQDLPKAFNIIDEMELHQAVISVAPGTDFRLPVNIALAELLKELPSFKELSNLITIISQIVEEDRLDPQNIESSLLLIDKLTEEVGRVWLSFVLAQAATRDTEEHPLVAKMAAFGEMASMLRRGEFTAVADVFNRRKDLNLSELLMKDLFPHCAIPSLIKTGVEILLSDTVDDAVAWKRDLVRKIHDTCILLAMNPFTDCISQGWEVIMTKAREVNSSIGLDTEPPGANLTLRKALKVLFYPEPKNDREQFCNTLVEQALREFDQTIDIPKSPLQIKMDQLSAKEAVLFNRIDELVQQIEKLPTDEDVYEWGEKVRQYEAEFPDSESPRLYYKNIGKDWFNYLLTLYSLDLQHHKAYINIWTWAHSYARSGFDFNEGSRLYFGGKYLFHLAVENDQLVCLAQTVEIYNWVILSLIPRTDYVQTRIDPCNIACMLTDLTISSENSTNRGWLEIGSLCNLEARNYVNDERAVITGCQGALSLRVEALRIRILELQTLKLMIAKIDASSAELKIQANKEFVPLIVNQVNDYMTTIEEKLRKDEKDNPSEINRKRIERLEKAKVQLQSIKDSLRLSTELGNLSELIEEVEFLIGDASNSLDKSWRWKEEVQLSFTKKSLAEIEERYKHWHNQYLQSRALVSKHLSTQEGILLRAYFSHCNYNSIDIHTDYFRQIVKIDTGLHKKYVLEGISKKRAELLIKIAAEYGYSPENLDQSHAAKDEIAFLANSIGPAEDSEDILSASSFSPIVIRFRKKVS